MHAHFMNGQRVVSPIVVINVLNPDSHVEVESTTATVNVHKEGKSFVGYIDDPLCSIDSLAITAASVEFAEGEVTYGYDGDSVKIIIKKEGFTATSVTASYTRVKFAASDIRATDFQKAVDAVDYVELKLGLIPTILVAPAFSKVPDLHDIMVQKTLDRAAAKWYLISLSDIPATDDVATRAEAIQWKADNQYNGKYDKVFYPMAAYGDKIYHLSTIGAYRMQATDIDNDDLPFVSPSNKLINVDRMCLANGDTVFYMENEANELNAVGITTMNIVKQTMRLWGSHMANYNAKTLSNINPEDRFDIQIRMMMYILNYLQYNYYDEIDETFTRKDIDAILNSIQTWLDSIVNAGALLYATVRFDPASNPVESIENGDLTFDLEVTYGISAKSITFKLQYTRTGLSLLTEGSEG
jgi:phage tail sheath protein FI